MVRPRAGGVTTSRRSFARVAAVAGSGLALRVAGAAAQGAGTPEPGELGRAAMPAWFFVVAAYQDPYPGVVQQPAEPPVGTRYVAADVVIDNASSQPLAYSPGDLHVRAADGVSYRGGSAYGTEPFIGPRILNGGERSRGWVWFIVAADADLVEIVYLPDAPQLRVPLPGGG